MEISDVIRLMHPVIAVTFVLPLIGMVVNLAWQTRQRRMQTKDAGKSKIPPVVGPEHLKLGRWLTGAVVGIALLGLVHPIAKTILKKNVWQNMPVQVLGIALFFVATIASLVLLYRATQWYWRATFASLAGIGLVVLGMQDGVFRRENEWYISHFHYGMLAALLMIFSLAIVPEIYRDRSHRWRIVHTVLNCLALLLFLGQGITGVRDLLDIPPVWSENYVFKCDWEKRVCPQSSLPALQDLSFGLLIMERFTI